MHPFCEVDGLLGFITISSAGGEHLSERILEILEGLRMKRFASVLSMVLLATVLIGIWPAELAHAEEYATVYSDNGYAVRLRKGPGTSYDTIIKCNVNTTVEVLQKGSEWSEVETAGITGWMMNQYLVFGATGVEDDENAGVTGIGTATVISDNGLRVWLRSTPGGTRLFLNRAGTEVTMIEYGDTWCQVCVAGHVGYMMTRYLSWGGSDDPVIPDSYEIESVSLNYPYPVAGDVLMPIVEPETAEYSCIWYLEVLQSDGTHYDPMKWEKVSTDPTYTVSVNNAGRNVKVTVTGVSPYFGSKSTQTDSTAAELRVVTGASITSSAIDASGHPIVGETLTAKIIPSSAYVTYSWRVGGVEASTDATYVVQAQDEGKEIQLRVEGIDPWSGNAVATTGTVGSATELISAELSNETPIVGEKLTLTLVPADASATYEWYVDGTLAAKTASYTVPDMVGSKISVKVTGKSPYTGTVYATTNAISKSGLVSVAINQSALSFNSEATAAVVPSEASAELYWYYITEDGNTVEAAGNPQLTFDLSAEGDAIKGASVYVKAVGTGVYGGTIASAKVGPVTDDTMITGVKLSNLTPVPGDVIHLTLTPSSLNDDSTGYVDESVVTATYTWTIGTRKEITSKPEYTVAADDVGYQISVRVVGKDGFGGIVTSDTTAKVTDTKKVTAVRLMIEETDENAANVRPFVGQTLVAKLTPASADGASLSPLTYRWYEDSSDTPFYEGAGSAYASWTISAAQTGCKIKVCVYQENDPAEYVISTSKGYVSATSKAVNDSTWSVDFGAIVHSGSADGSVFSYQPKTSVTASQILDADGNVVVNNKGNKITAKATIKWYGDPNYSMGAELDANGNLLPGKEYYAKLTPAAPSGYSLSGLNTLTVDSALGDCSIALDSGKSPNPDTSHCYYYKVTVNATTQYVTDFYITKLPTVEFGDTTSSYGSGLTGTSGTLATEQYYVSAITDVKAETSDVPNLSVTFTVVPQSGYEFSTDSDNKINFVVSNATSTSTTVNSASSATVKATFKVDASSFQVVGDHSTVELDGTNRVIVHCVAKLKNYVLSGSEVLDVDWQVLRNTSASTTIDTTGMLIVGADETTGNTITVKATWETSAGLTLTGTWDVYVESGTPDSTIKVQFFDCPSTVEPGDTVTMNAYAINSTLGVTYKAWGRKQATTIDADTGVLTVAGNEPQDEYIVVRAYSKEDPTIYSAWALKVINSLTTEDTTTEMIEDFASGDIESMIDSIEAWQIINAEEEAAELEALDVDLSELDLTEEEVEEEATEPVEGEGTEGEATEPTEGEDAEAEETEAEAAEPTENEETAETEETEEPEEPVAEEPAAEESKEDDISLNTTGDVLFTITSSEGETTAEGSVDAKGKVDTTAQPVEKAEEEPAAETGKADSAKDSKKTSTTTEPAADEKETLEEELAASEEADTAEDEETELALKFTKAAKTVKRGRVSTFEVGGTAAKDGYTFMLTGSKNGSKISAKGKLYVAANEEADTLRVWAVSKADSSVRCVVTVNVVTPAADDTEGIETFEEDTSTETTTTETTTSEEEMAQQAMSEAGGSDEEEKATEEKTVEEKPAEEQKDEAKTETAQEEAAPVQEEKPAAAPADDNSTENPMDWF